MEDMIPGASHLRPEKVETCAARTAEMARAERDLVVHTLVAIAANSRAPLGRQVVMDVAILNYGLNSEDMEVDLIS
jgi:hypothetical protein